MTNGQLTPRQWLILVALGVALWFGAILLIRALESMGALRTPWVAFTYLLVVPGTWPFVVLARRIASLRQDQTATGLAIVTLTAALLDGIALTAAPAVYGADPVAAGAVLLWGVGVGLLLGVVSGERGTAKG